VGLTTSGAAKNQKFIRMLGSAVVIIEEAGQVTQTYKMGFITLF